jgi:hypothetical protein
MVAARLPHIRLAGAYLLVPAANGLLVLTLTRSRPMLAVALAVLPLVVLLLGSIISSQAHVLVFAGLGISMSQRTLNLPYNVGGIGLYLSDLVVFLAACSWLANRAIGNRERAPGWRRTPVLELPYVLFAGAMLVAILRGHFDNGESLFGQPLRLVLYAAIGAALAGADAHRLYRGIVVVFSSGCR